MNENPSVSERPLRTTPTLTVRTPDLGSLFQLMGEVDELTRARTCPREHLLRGLAALIDADIALFCVAKPAGRGQWRAAEVCEHGWATSTERQLVYDYAMTRVDPLSQVMLSSQEVGIRVARRCDVIADAVWHETELHRDVHLPLGLDDVLVGVHSRSARDGVRLVVFKKRRGRRPFGCEDRDLVHLALVQARCLDRQDAPPPSLAKLAPREVQVLDALLSGLSEKQAAAALGLRTSTLHTYVKDVYRKLAVSSRAELISRYLAPRQATARLSTPAKARSLPE